MAQVALRKALQDPAVYPEHPVTVAVRETHISLVFLTNEYVYKIKKPVNLGFVDFSTLEKRCYCCEQEVTLNQRLSSGVYLDVVPLYRDPQGGYTFTASGPVVEYAVKMRRLPDNLSLEALVEHEAATERSIDAVARRLAAFHADHPLAETETAYGTLAQVRHDWQDNFDLTRRYIGKTLSATTYAYIQQAVNTFLGRHADWFDQRIDLGCIRDCHGDLRAEHIYLEAQHLSIIDGIEFNPALRYIDVASEVAFLVADLERLQASALASHFVRAYVRASGDVTLYRMLDFYCSYRAYVRGKVTSLFLQEALPEQARLYAQQQAECLFDLAARYARRLHRPRCILTTGLIGSGKSTMGQAVAAALALPVISSDRLRISATGAVLDTPQNAAYGSGMYSVAARDQVYDKLAAVAREHLQQGRSILLDASFSSRAQRQRLVELAQTLDADCGILECWAPEAVLRQRLRQRDQAPASNSEARENILQAFERHYEPVQAAEFPWHIRLDTSQDVMDCAQAALAMLQARQS